MEEPATACVGRGRGRGGVPVLPAGMWDSLNSSSRKDNYDVDNIQLGKDSDRQSGDDSNGEDRDDLATYGYMPSSFGRGRGRGLGRDSGRNSGRGRGLERDVKGKDWDCPSCSNTNWSWRSACNKCGTGKPIVYATNVVRDGVGKGFNERQERASYAAVEIDEDGFDDFGRRVKKTNEDKRAKEEAALKRMQEKYKLLMQVQEGVEELIESSANDENNRDKERTSDSRRNGDDRPSERGSHRNDTSVNNRTRDRSPEKNRDRDRSRDRRRSRDRDRDRSRDRRRKDDSRVRNRDDRDNKRSRY